MRHEWELLELSLKKLSGILPDRPENMLEIYRRDGSGWQCVREDDGLYYCLFSFQDKKIPAERMVLLVYEENTVIADLAALHCSQNVLMNSVPLYDGLSSESDWMYLEHYVLCGCLYPDEPYPFCENSSGRFFEGEALIYSNAYVTRRVRRRGIFCRMESMARSFALRRCSGLVRLGAVFSMDPDIACYGPDTTDEPYIYSFEKDEPDRLRNAEIAKKVGYHPLRLELEDPADVRDGTKLWFCIRIENSVML